MSIKAFAVVHQLMEDDVPLLSGDQYLVKQCDSWAHILSRCIHNQPSELHTALMSSDMACAPQPPLLLGALSPGCYQTHRLRLRLQAMPRTQHQHQSFGAGGGGRLWSVYDAAAVYVLLRRWRSLEGGGVLVAPASLHAGARAAGLCKRRHKQPRKSEGISRNQMCIERANGRHAAVVQLPF